MLRSRPRSLRVCRNDLEAISDQDRLHELQLIGEHETKVRAVGAQVEDALVAAGERRRDGTHDSAQLW